jgi:hypothetical protein
MSEHEHSEPEAPTISVKDKTKNLDVFFSSAGEDWQEIGGKPGRRACILGK